MINRGEHIVIVSGLPRSGTSMMMSMLEAGGVPALTDELRKPDGDNPNGYFELERVKALRHGDTGWLTQARGRAVKIVSELLRRLPPSHAYRIIFMRRDLDEVLSSQRAMLASRGAESEGASDDELRALYEKHLKDTEGWIEKQPNMRVIYMDYAGLVSHPAPRLRQLDDFLGGGLDTEAMAAIADPALYRQRTGHARSRG